jgi:homoserine kinase
MSNLASVSVTVPATTANIGPGFDCLGAALTLYNRFHFQVTALNDPSPQVSITVQGSDSKPVSLGADNLAYTSFLKVFHHLQQPAPSIAMTLEMEIPLARGLGSSATAIVGGLVGANAIAGHPLSPDALLDLAIAIEGHPDNVAPALLGHCQLSTHDPKGDRWVLCPIPWASTIVPIVAIPAFELSTAEARAVLPKTCPYSDAIFNTAHLGLLLQGLSQGNPDWIRTALQDKLHQPFRERLIPGYAAVRAAAIAAGAYGLVISGAGPTLLALGAPDSADAIAAAMVAAWSSDGIAAQAHCLALDCQGAVTVANKETSIQKNVLGFLIR